MSKDSLSALLDGECSGPELDRLLDEIERSPALAREWSRMCLAREAHAGTQVRVDQPCICSAVMSALDAAPAADARVVDLAVHRAARGRRISRAWKPLAGLAAAASVGAAAALFVRPSGPVGPEPWALASIGSPARWAPAQDTNLQPVLNDDAHAQMLREYLIDHSNAISDEGMGGTLRYARFAAHTAEYKAGNWPQSDELP